MKLNFYLIEYAINALYREKTKNTFVFVILTLLVFLLSSSFFIVNSIKYELNQTVKSLPSIIVQNTKASRVYDIETSVVDDILSLSGVSYATPRVWGYYYFENSDTNFVVVGIDKYEKQYKKLYQDIVENFDIDNLDSNSSMLVGKGVKYILQKSYYDKYFNFIKPDGTIKKLTIAGVFNSTTSLESNDMIIVSIDQAREIFDIDDEMATDIVVQVSNPTEIPTVVEKIKTLYPNTKITTKDDIKVSYQNLFDYKSGIFLALFLVVLFTFFIIVYDKISGFTSTQTKEIGILKALGWKIEDVLKEKFYESFIISFGAYILGSLFALVFVYILQAPYLKYIFIGYSNILAPFELPFILDIQTFVLIFFLSVPIYIASTIIPSWKIATLETDEVIR